MAHSRKPACAGCHTIVDPIGFAVEHDDDGGHAIDALGEIVRSPASDAQFDGVAELSAVLAASEDVRACHLSQWDRYGFGVDDALPLGCYVNRLGEDFEALHDILPALTGTTHCRERNGADLVPTAPGSAPEMPDPEVPTSRAG